MPMGEHGRQVGDELLKSIKLVSNSISCCIVIFIIFCNTGVSSELISLPPGFEHRTMLMAGNGITSTLDAWGTAMRKLYGTNRTSNQDLNVEYLSYWTDNGIHLSKLNK